MTHPPYGDDARERGPGGEDRPPAPGWGPPRSPEQQPHPGQPPYGAPQYGPPGQPQHGTPQYGQPQYGAPQYGAPQYGQPQYGQPQYGQPQYGQPQYGQPQYGPPGQPGYGPPQYAQPGWEQPDPPRRSRRPPFLLGLLVLAAVIGIVLALTGTGSTALDPQAVQRDVAEQFQEREGVAVELRCGDDMVVEAGSTYRCSGTTADGEAVTIEIAITDEDANYTWDEG